MQIWSISGFFQNVSYAFISKHFLWLQWNKQEKQINFVIFILFCNLWARFNKICIWSQSVWQNIKKTWHLFNLALATFWATNDNFLLTLVYYDLFMGIVL